jgi:U3 small nucleolar RNA-associated protein 15
LLLAGDASGKVQLFELKNRYALRSYTMGKNRVNALSFSENNRNFASCANDTCIRYYDIQDSSNKCAIEIASAHSDNIKKVHILSEHHLLSASADRHMKLWDLRSTSKPVCSFKVENSIEDFCVLPNNKLVLAQGNTLTLAKLADDSIRRLNDFYPF